MPNILQFIPKKSFIHSWLHAHEEDEAPKSFQIIVALAALATALRRRVYYDYDLNKRVNTVLNVLFLGPPGLGKTEVIRHIEQELLSILPEARRPYAIGPATKEKLLDTLTVHPHAIIMAS